MSRQMTIEVEAVAPAGYTLRIEQGPNSLGEKFALTSYCLKLFAVKKFV